MGAGTPRRIVREERPYNAGTPLEVLAEPITPTPSFFVRSHFDVPRIDPAAWRLRVAGEVERPLELSLEELRSGPVRTEVVSLECAGNGRTLMEPRPGGTPWELEAASSARFTGTPLHGILDRAGVAEEAVEVVFEGADRGEVEPGRTVAFERSLPVEEVRRPDVLLAWEMNGEPLPAEHGGPVRLLVPGWYGMASVKWLVGISPTSEPFRGYYQAERYVYEGLEGVPDGTPLTRQRVRAIVARPSAGAVLEAGPVEIAGAAWSGRGTVRAVEVSVDDGRTWREAELAEPLGPHAPVPWGTVRVLERPGRYRILARATDETGATQPLEPRWNAHGYGNNVVHRVEVEVR